MTDDKPTARTCPYCGIRFSIAGVNADNSFPRFEGAASLVAGRTVRPEGEPQYSITSHRCPECRGQVMWLNTISGALLEDREVTETQLLFPKFPVKHVAPQIPVQYASELREAHSILDLSPKASAAISRRTLQRLIRDKEGIQKPTLHAEIDEVLGQQRLPPYLAKDLDAIRNVGNFAAHPIKDTNTGDIVDVEPGEAAWNLEILEALLNFYFVDSERSDERRAALNQKLSDAGKKPML